MKKLQADLLMISITALWGSSFIVTKNILGQISPMAFLFLRFSFASLVLAIIFFKELKKLNLDIFKYGLVLAVLITVTLDLQIEGLKYTTVSNSAFITSLNVIFVPFFSVFLLRKNPNASNLTGAALAVFGIYFIAGNIHLSVNYGDFLTLLCALCCAIYIIAIDKFVRKQPGILLGIAQSFCVIPVSAVFCLFMDTKFFLSPSAPTKELLIAVFITGIFCTAIAFTGQVYVQQFISPARLAVIGVLEPVFALMFALFIPGTDGNVEVLTAGKAVGAALVIMGALISELNLVKRRNNHSI